MQYGVIQFAEVAIKLVRPVSDCWCINLNNDLRCLALGFGVFFNVV